jgi:hypothetical protein
MARVPTAPTSVGRRQAERSVEMTSRMTHRSAARSQPAARLALFAGILMIIVGSYHVLLGISALFHDTIYVPMPGYTYEFDLTGWGWVHLVLGAVVLAVGVAVVQAREWGRICGMAVACVSLVASFLFLPYYPLWAAVIIALDITFLWALANDPRKA